MFIHPDPLSPKQQQQTWANGREQLLPDYGLNRGRNVEHKDEKYSNKDSDDPQRSRECCYSVGPSPWKCLGNETLPRAWKIIYARKVNPFVIPFTATWSGRTTRWGSCPELLGPACQKVSDCVSQAHSSTVMELRLGTATSCCHWGDTELSSGCQWEHTDA